MFCWEKWYFGEKFAFLPRFRFQGVWLWAAGRWSLAITEPLSLCSRYKTSDCSISLSFTLVPSINGILYNKRGLFWVLFTHTFFIICKGAFKCRGPLFFTVSGADISQNDPVRARQNTFAACLFWFPGH